MATPKEIEIKLELAPASLPRLKKIPLIRALEAPVKRTAEVSVYFDTDKHKLRKKGLMLRVRHIGDRYIQTIKATGHGGLFERDEWESEIAGEQPDLGLAGGTALEPLIERQVPPAAQADVRDPGDPDRLSLDQRHALDRAHGRPGQDRYRQPLGAVVRDRARAQARE